MQNKYTYSSMDDYELVLSSVFEPKKKIVDMFLGDIALIMQCSISMIFTSSYIFI